MFVSRIHVCMSRFFQENNVYGLLTMERASLNHNMGNEQLFSMSFKNHEALVMAPLATG